LSNNRRGRCGAKRGRGRVVWVGRDNGITQHLSPWGQGQPPEVVVVSVAVSLQIALAGNCVYEHGKRKRPQKQPSNEGHKQKRQDRIHWKIRVKPCFEERISLRLDFSMSR